MPLACGLHSSVAMWRPLRIKPMHIALLIATAMYLVAGTAAGQEPFMARQVVPETAAPTTDGGVAVDATAGATEETATPPQSGPWGQPTLAIAPKKPALFGQLLRATIVGTVAAALLGGSLYAATGALSHGPRLAYSAAGAVLAGTAAGAVQWMLEDRRYNERLRRVGSTPPATRIIVPVLMAHF
jgi:hypothetical protein